LYHAENRPSLASDQSSAKMRSMFGRKGIFDNLEISLDNQSGIEMPLRIYRSEMIMSYFEADLEPIRAWIPHERIHPIRRGSHKSVLCFIQTYCNHASIPPFRSVSIAVPVTIGKRPAPAYLPLLFEESWINKGYYIHQEAVDSSEVYEARTEIWGYPEFLAEINTQMISDSLQETEVSEEERLFTLRVKRPDYVKDYDKTLKIYSVKQNVVCENKLMIEAGHESKRDPDASIIVFGNHPIGRQLKSMNVGPHALETRYFLDMKAVQPYPNYLD
jgi:hypothetical protein